MLSEIALDKMKRQRLILLAGGMVAIDKLPYSTVQFMLEIYDLFFNHKYVNCVDMAETCEMSPQAARFHVQRLEQKGYLKRIHYRAWEINSEYLTTLRLQ